VRKRTMSVRGLAAMSAMVMTVVSTPVVTATPAQAVPAPAMVAEIAQARTVVTLVTGDKVVVGHDDVEFVPAQGRERVGYRRYAEHDAMYVVPNDAAALIADGTLDKRLFDVTTLVKAGYHDGVRDDVPMLVSYRDDTSSGTRARAAVDGAAVETRSLAAITGAALETVKTEAKKFWDRVRPMLEPGAEIERLWLDAPVQATLAESVPQIGAPEAWDSGLTGEGVRVAVLDTGIDADHPDLADAVVEAEDFTGSGNTDDGQGHGTHVAGTIVGDGSASDGRYRGVAPDAELVVGKVLDDDGFGQESWILAGMEWAAENASVVNMSLGGDATDGTDPMSLALNELTESTGALFVVAAGNMGADETVGSPGSADAALTVGAVTKDDELADFSSRGPRLGDGAVKPDVTAPGADIVAPMAEGTALGTPVDERYVTLSGTSMATPHVAGAAALLAQQHQDWDADELKAALIGSAQAHRTLSVFEQGAGRIDVPKALTQSLLASPASLSLGIVEWPRTDDEPVQETITYTNVSDTAVTVDLRATLSGPDGAAPEGMITVEPSRLTVPAGESAEATVTVDTRVGGPDGRYGGVVTATADGTTVTTPVGIEQEVESYRLDLTVIDHDGTVATNPYVMLAGHAKPWSEGGYHETGEISLRLPKDDYFLAVEINDDYTVPGSTSFFEPRISLDSDRSLVLDARDAVPVDVVLDEPDAEIGYAELDVTLRTEGHPYIGWFAGDSSLEDTYVRPSETRHDGFAFSLRTEHARPDGDGGFDGSPFTYHLRHSATIAVPDDLTYEVTTAELAKVTSVHTDGGPGVVGSRELVTGELPFTLTEYYTPGVRWNSMLWLGDSPEAAGEFSLSHVATFEPGDNGELRWNTPVFGPAFPPGSLWAVRDDDSLLVSLPLYGHSLSGGGGFSITDSGFTELYRDGERLAREEEPGYGIFDVPAEPGQYRLVVESERGSLTPLSRTIRAEWTFRSGPSEAEVDLPLLAVQFAPELGDDHAGEVGEAVRIPIAVHRNGLTGKPDLASLSVEVSFDGGESWSTTPVTDGAVVVTAPDGAEDVSLRAVAKDADGNEVTQTILGAYLVT
jgi:subtilisin family serine protease